MEPRAKIESRRRTEMSINLHFLSSILLRESKWKLRWCAPSLASKVPRILAISAPRVLGMFRISAEGAAPPGERLPRCNYGVRCGSLLHPVHNGAQHVETVERRAAAAVRHSRHQEQSAPFGYLVGSAVGSAQ